ncbi:MAG: PmoA family protein [Bryobacteraceae bacterium]
MKAAYLLIVLAAAPLFAQVGIKQGSDRILVTIDGKPFTDFFIGSGSSKPYLHPLRAASGTVVTRAYPMEMLEGESHDHVHHRGLWFTHGNVNGIDFWANEPSQSAQGKKGKVVVKKVGELKGGKKSGSLEATFDWLQPDGKPILTEQRKMTFYAHPTLRTIDFDITLTAIEQAKFGDTKEGTFAIRLAPWMEEPTRRSLASPKRTGKMVASDGKQGESQIWGKRAPWVDYYGQTGEETLGVAIMDHPSNPKHPTYWHARSYGLFAANVFGEHDYYNDKSRDGGLTVPAGGTLRFVYRVVIHPGNAEQAGIAGIYQQFSKMKVK